MICAEHVCRLLAVDWVNGFAYVSGNYTHPTEKEICRLSFNDRSVIVCGWPDRGWHDGYVNIDSAVCVDSFR